VREHHRSERNGSKTNHYSDDNSRCGSTGQLGTTTHKPNRADVCAPATRDLRGHGLVIGLRGLDELLRDVRRHLFVAQELHVVVAAAAGE
jgi:hypothetical protein